MKEEHDDVEISMKDELICLILRKIALITLITSFSQMAKMAVNEKMGAAGDWT